MCGICGALGNNYEPLGFAFTELLKHRGPDDSGVHLEHSIKLSLGHTRLSIIDVGKSGQQPMSNERGDNILVFNGEIYNYKELRGQLQNLGYRFRTNSDTEVILVSYEEWGVTCIDHFRGMFAFCLFDSKRDQLFLARDRFGITPLYFSMRPGQFVFSSEIKPFLKSGLYKYELDKMALSDYFSYGAVKQPRTIIKDVQALMPGHYMTVKSDLSWEIKQYYSLPRIKNDIMGVEEYSLAKKRIRNELQKATEYHLQADVEVGSFLSGGIDSTAVTALMNKISNKPIKTFSLGFQDNTNVEDETDIAERTAHFLGTEHTTIKINDDYVKRIFNEFVSSIDQPSVDGINAFIISREAAKKVKVAISGLGGDEIFAGYPHFDYLGKNTYLNKLPFGYLGRLLYWISPKKKFFKMSLIGTTPREAILKIRKLKHKGPALLKYPLNSKPNKHKESLNLSFIQQLSKAEIEDYMLNTLLRDNNILCLANSLESRPVLLDHKLVELAFDIKDSFKIRDNTLKSIFIDSVKDIIPTEVYSRKKSGFEMPFERWLNGIFNDDFIRLVDEAMMMDIFNSKAL